MEMGSNGSSNSIMRSRCALRGGEPGPSTGHAAPRLER
jgi:hypothetical protein